MLSPCRAAYVREVATILLVVLVFIEGASGLHAFSFTCRLDAAVVNRSAAVQQLRRELDEAEDKYQEVVRVSGVCVGWVCGHA